MQVHLSGCLLAPTGLSVRSRLLFDGGKNQLIETSEWVREQAVGWLASDVGCNPTIWRWCRA